MQTKSAIDIENVERTVNSGGMDGLTTGCTTWWSGSTTVCAAGAAARVRWAAAAAAAWCGARPDDEDDDVDMPTYGVWCACLRGSVAASSSCSYTRQHIDVKNVFYVFYLWKTLAKFRAASRLTRSTFKITATKQAHDFLLHVEWMNGIFRVALKAISWASGVELNYTKKR